ncbi:MAG: ABC transporter ATP-binding protein/permease [Candidatus Thorarchaeota archaeon]|nr:ABC transporter ATP-binding protein/permease [Candidatus Thorarchaeota archaeon]
MTANAQRYASASRYMLSGILKHKGIITLATILTGVSAYLTTIPSVIVGRAIDVLTVSGLSPEFMSHVWTLVDLAVIYMGMYFFVGYAWAVVTFKWERDARQDFFETVQDYSMAFHDEVDSKRLLSVAMQDINWIRLSLNPALRNIMGSLLSLFITGFLLIKYDTLPSIANFVVVNGFSLPIFTLIVFVGSPIYVAFAYRYANTIEPVRRARSETMEHLTSVAQGVFTGIEVVRAFGAENKEKQKFQQVSVKYADVVAKEGRLAAFYLPAIVLICMTTAAFFYGTYAVFSGVLSVGTLTSILGLLIALEFMNFQLPRMLLMFRGGYVNAQRIVELLNWKDPLVEADDEATDVNWLGDITFDHVSFSYDHNHEGNKHYAIQDLDITIPGGSRVALIGGPGSGKSTVLKLLLRFYDPIDGTITIDGIDLRRINTRTIRNAVGLVEQDIFLFRRSVRDNIAFGRKDATIEEIIEAAKRAQAHDFIVELPDGYDTVIGERGTTLSGGQRQRLAIARAILQDPKILLLDDSVSAVDAETEYHLRKALSEVMKGRTSITVTQRLRTLLESDMIIILDKGRLIASGTHAELIRESPVYQHIFERLPGAQSMVARVSGNGGVA